MVAESITGIASKNEKFVAVERFKPKYIPPMIAAPDLLKPGIKANVCTKPIFIALFFDMFRTLLTLCFFLRCKNSTWNINNAPTMNDKPTKRVSKRFSSINFPNNNPKTPIGRNAMVRD